MQSTPRRERLPYLNFCYSHQQLVTKAPEWTTNDAEFQSASCFWSCEYATIYFWINVVLYCHWQIELDNKRSRRPTNTRYYHYCPELAKPSRQIRPATKQHRQRGSLVARQADDKGRVPVHSSGSAAFGVVWSVRSILRTIAGHDCQCEYHYGGNVSIRMRSRWTG